MAEVTGLRNNALNYPVYGAPFGVTFPILDADGDLVTGASSLDSEVSKNGDTFADCTNEATEIATSSGYYYLLLTATEMTADVVTVIVKNGTAGAKTVPITLYPRKLVTIRSGTAAGGASGSITLDGSASAVDDFYNGMLVVGTLDSNVEARIITDYVGSTKVASVTPNWNTTPDSDDTFIVYLPEGVQVNQANVSAYGGVAGTFSSGRPEVNASHAAGTAWNSGAIGASTLASDTITAAKIASDAITAAKIAADAITAAKIADGAIDAATFAAGAITSTVIATGAIDADAIADGAIDAGAIAADAITAAKLAADVTTELQSGLATAANLATVAGYLDTEMAATLAAVLNLVAAGYTRTGTAQAGGATSITLDASASAVDDFYNNQIVVIGSGTGAGQARFISDYVGSTKVATVPTWATNPDNTSVFYVLPFGSIPGATAPTAVEIRQEIDANSTQLAKLGTPAGASISADILTIDNLVDDLESRIGTPSNLGGGATISANLSDIEAQTDDIGAAGAGLTALATQASVDDLPTNAELATALAAADDAVLTQVALVKAKTDNLPADPADASDIASSFSTVNTKLDTIDDFLDLEVAAIKAKTDNLPSDPADASDIASAFSTVNSTLSTIGGYVDTEVAAIKAKTDQLTFTVANTLDANVKAVDGSTTGVDKLAAHLPAVLKVVVGSGSTTTAVVLNASTGINGGAPSSTNDFYNGRVLIFTSGALAGQATSVTDYDGASVTLTVVALTGAPSSGVTAVIV